MGFINNGNSNKSDLAAKGSHLKDLGSSKLANNFLDYIYVIFVIGNSIWNEIKQNHGSMIRVFQVNEISHQKCALGYLNINSIRNKFCSNLCLTENNWDVFLLAEAKADLLFTESQLLLEEMRKRYRLNIFAKKSLISSFVRIFLLNIFKASIFQEIYSYTFWNNFKAGKTVGCLDVPATKAKLRLRFVFRYGFS